MGLIKSLYFLNYRVVFLFLHLLQMLNLLLTSKLKAWYLQNSIFYLNF